MSARCQDYSAPPATAPATPPPPPLGATCVLGATGADVQVEVTGQASCAADISALAGDGLNWYPVGHLSAPGSPGSADGETLYIVCKLYKGSSSMTVLDAGGAFYGTDICSSEEQAGWTP